MWLGMSKEAKDIICLSASLIFLSMSNFEGTTILAIGCALLYLKEWEKD